MISTMTEPGVVLECSFHREYFWDLLTFKVENVLIRVPSYRFGQSKTFVKKHGIDIGRKGPLDSCNEEPIELEVELVDFEHFVKAMYPIVPFYSGDPELTKDEWISVLRLSTKWFFSDMREVAIRKLTEMEMDPIDRVCLGKELHIHRWLLTGYEYLVTRKEIITEEEAERIGWRTALKVSGLTIRRLRECHPPGVAETFDVDISTARVMGSSYVRDQESSMASQQGRAAAERVRKLEAEKKEKKEIVVISTDTAAITKEQNSGIDAVSTQLTSKTEAVQVQPVEVVLESDTAQSLALTGPRGEVSKTSRSLLSRNQPAQAFKEQSQHTIPNSVTAKLGKEEETDRVESQSSLDPPDVPLWGLQVSSRKALVSRSRNGRNEGKPDGRGACIAKEAKRSVSWASIVASQEQNSPLSQDKLNSKDSDSDWGTTLTWLKY
ncbi:hypothetical protein FA15DRAFT_620526 [Coprinopsis marcescibilis]|uniref:BTB domain-containing protein n=1 Tax=Coprinopsis marcescibilis TaxID=230819 RepID=A0A5C3KT18_COPMA|nr:hypothetical protein FA15DRAFT_620526 [Coprinopsis marcescibilis]